MERNDNPDQKPVSVDNNQDPSGTSLSVSEAFGFAWEMGYTMAIPLVLLALGGRLLDKWYDTSPIFLLIGIFISIIVSSILLGFKATEIIGRTCPVPKKQDDTIPPQKNDTEQGN